MVGLSVLVYTSSLCLILYTSIAAANRLLKPTSSNHYVDDLHDLNVHSPISSLQGDTTRSRNLKQLLKTLTANSHDEDVDSNDHFMKDGNADRSLEIMRGPTIKKGQCPSKCVNSIKNGNGCKKKRCKEKCSQYNLICPMKCEADDVSWETKCSVECADCQFSACKKCKTIDTCALQKLYFATNGQLWNSSSDKNAWYDSMNHCKWYGLSCVNKRVVEISLDRNNLEGKIPSEIFSLPKLRVLQLESNNLYGPIPNIDPESKELKHINLNENHLTGLLPEPLAYPTEELLLSGNSFDGPIPKFPDNMIRVDLSHNFIRGTFLDAGLGTNSSMKQLNLRGNKMHGHIPNDLGNLEDLDLSENYFSGSIPSVFPSMKYLRISSNKLLGTFPFGLGYKECSDDDDDDYYDVAANKAPKDHDHTSHEHRGAVRRLCHNVPILEFENDLIVLDLSFNGITGCLPDICCDLEDLLFSDNKLTGTIPDNIWSATQISLKNNFIEGILPKSTGMNTNDSYWYDLSNNKISGTLPTTFLSNVNWVNLTQNELIGTISDDFASISVMTDAKYLLDDNMITGTIPESLWFNDNVSILSLEDNLLNGTIPEGNISMTSFSLGSNFITGTIPAKIGDSKRLTHISLENNLIMGIIPTQIGLLSGQFGGDLVRVNLRKNCVTGSILNGSDICSSHRFTVVVDCDNVDCECCQCW